LPSRIASVTTPGTGRQEGVVVNQGYGWTLHFLLSEGYSVFHIVDSFRRLLISEDGPTAVEYAVMLALILVACIAIVTTLGQSMSSDFSTINGSIAGS
jgi:pilus assembly protein Flp/PilA